METAKEEITLQELKGMADRGGLLDEDIKRKSEELKDIKDKLTGAAAEHETDGEALEIEGDSFKAVVAYTPELELSADAAKEVDALDEATGQKLFPYSVTEAHHEFTGNEEAVDELRKLDKKLYKKLFNHIPQEVNRKPDIAKLRNAARSEAKDKKKQKLRELVLQWVTGWMPKSVSFTRL